MKHSYPLAVALAWMIGCGGGGGGSGGDATIGGDTGSGSGLPATACMHVQDPTSACCERDGDCPAGQFQNCAAPGTPEGCGICQDPANPCTDDNGCAGSGSNLICEPAQCGCDGAMECVAGCTAATDCGDGQACDLGTRRCAALTCDGSGASTCPVNFECTGGHCGRLPCTTDDNCQGSGYCIEGACYPTAGECRSPVA